MNFTEICELMTKFENSNIYSLDLTLGDAHIKLEKANHAPQNGAFCISQNVQPPVNSQPVPTAAPSTPPQPQEEKREQKTIDSPIVGIVYNAPTPEKPPFVTEGAKVKKGDVLLLIEAMKMFNNITAPCDCVVEKILVENEQLVEFGTPLLVIKESTHV